MTKLKSGIKYDFSTLYTIYIILYIYTVCHIYVYFVRNFDWAAAARNDFCHVEEVNLQPASKFVQVASGTERERERESAGSSDRDSTIKKTQEHFCGK